ncbi:MAG: glycosyltransferase family 2 protein [Desulfobacca sp.]|nr:glycosyltransferase family 2 protein [Desulfobacca sp.]
MFKLKKPSLKVALLAVLISSTILLMFAYLMVRSVLFIISDYHWYEKIVAFFLLCAEGFLLVHGMGYFFNILHVLTHPTAVAGITAPIPPLKSYPPVAIIVSSYREPLAVVEDTLTCFYNLTYTNKHLFFLDDTRYDLPQDDPQAMARYRQQIDDLCQRLGVNLFRRQWRGAKAGMINDFLDFIEGHSKPGFSFLPFAEKKRTVKEKYIFVFDADMNPFPDFVEPLVAIMEDNPKLAFVQTPQYYSNFERNRVARAAGLQQVVFYEYICEGKSIDDAMFCCGTNVIFRREALVEVGGFDESSVTEDFATSLKFHMGGWSSAYMNRVLAFGLGPEDLGGYFKQQFRWALGTVGLFRTILKEFFRHPFQLTATKWWEYFLSGTWYFVGWVFLVMAYCPILFLYFNVPSFFVRPEVYFVFFVPYFVLSLTLFFATLNLRKYRASDIFQGMLLNAISFPVFIKASTLAMLGVRGTFAVTPKGQSRALPLKALWPQLITAALSFGAIAWGMLRLYYEREPFYAILVNSIWCLYHFLLFSTVLYFNFPEEPE